ARVVAARVALARVVAARVALARVVGVVLDLVEMLVAAGLELRAKIAQRLDFSHDAPRVRRGQIRIDDLPLERRALPLERVGVLWRLQLRRSRRGLRNLVGRDRRGRLLAECHGRIVAGPPRTAGLLGGRFLPVRIRSLDYTRDRPLEPWRSRAVLRGRAPQLGFYLLECPYASRSPMMKSVDSRMIPPGTRLGTSLPLNRAP